MIVSGNGGEGSATAVSMGDAPRVSRSSDRGASRQLTTTTKTAARIIIRNTVFFFI